MIPLFLGLTALNLLCLGTAAALGYAYGGTARGGQHILAGAVAALVGSGVHCVVFTYFVATAKWVRHAIDVRRLDPALAAPTRSFRARPSPRRWAPSRASSWPPSPAPRRTITTGPPGRGTTLWYSSRRGQRNGRCRRIPRIDRNGRLIDSILDRINPRETPTGSSP